MSLLQRHSSLTSKCIFERISINLFENPNLRFFKKSPTFNEKQKPWIFFIKPVSILNNFGDFYPVDLVVGLFNSTTKIKIEIDLATKYAFECDIFMNIIIVCDGKGSTSSLQLAKKKDLPFAIVLFLL